MHREYPDRPIVGVGAVVLRGSSVLLVKRARPPRQGQWSLPGGAQELGETLDDAVAREVREEAGIEISIQGMIDALDSISRDKQGAVQFHYTLFDVAARWRAGEPDPGGDAAEARFVPLDDLEKYDLWTETLRVIELADRMLGDYTKLHR